MPTITETMTNDGLPRAASPDAGFVPFALLDGAWKVNDVLRSYPETIATMNALGIDACCGGANSLIEAARDAGIEPGVLIDALIDAIRPATSGSLE
jgi:hypothetical protein